MSARILPLFLIAALLSVSSLSAQVHGVPASVSSFGFGGNFSSAPGVPASVTSLGPNGFNQGPAFFGNCCFNGFPTSAHSPVLIGRHHGNRRAFFPVAVPVYTVPYTPVYLVQPEAAAYEDEQDQGGPTVFDRSGSGTRRVRERIVEEEPALATPAVTAPPPEPVTPQPSTLLVFKDGHKSEVQNYAIVGEALFNLSEGRSYKILLADLDLTATRHANSERGVDFQLPPGSAR
jgi:hypothetical protein